MKLHIFKEPEHTLQMNKVVKYDRKRKKINPDFIFKLPVILVLDGHLADLTYYTTSFSVSAAA